MIHDFAFSYSASPLSTGSNSVTTTGISSKTLSTFIIAYFIFIAIVAIFYLICQWKIYAKAGKPGWAAIVPIYNIMVLLEISGKPAWWTILYFVPVAILVVAVIVSIELAKRFG